jgi:serine/threonine protein kinase/tetratricopeptide (TPR) repeat protein
MSTTSSAPFDGLTIATVMMGSARELAAPLPSSDSADFSRTTAMPRVPGYELLDVLGEGGMGVVYRARQHTLKRLVALKMIASDRASSAIRERFQTEAETIARLQHPNFVQIYEVGECDGRPFLALEYVQGGSLADHLNEHGPFSARDAAKLVSMLAHAMHHAHQQGVIHRDLKPANALIVDQGLDLIDAEDGSGVLCKSRPGGIRQLKISDFGLAKLLDSDQSRTRSGAVMGTPVYMAPEQAQGQAVGVATDVYALGAILFECLTGRPPFEGESSWEVLMRVVGTDAAPPSRLRPKLSRDLDTICLKCLAKDPGRRYTSALSLAEDLDRFVAGEAIAARPECVFAKLRRRVRRRPIRPALAILTIGSLLLLGGLWQLRRTEARDALDEGNDLLRRCAYGDARDRFDRGMQPIKCWPGCSRLRDDLQRGMIIAELNRLSRDLMFCNDPAHLDSETLKALVDGCRRLWNQRQMVLSYASDQDQNWEEQARAILRDIALRGIELEGWLAKDGNGDAQRAHEEALELVDELQAFGAPSDVLELEQCPHLRALGQTDRIRSELRTPGTAAEYHQLGRAYWNLERLDDAASCFQLGLEENPRELALYFDQATLAFKRGHLETALASYTACLALHPAPTIYSRRGFTYLALADSARASAAEDLLDWDWRQGIEHLDQTRRFLAHARRDFDEALNQDPDLAEARFGRGQACLRSHDIPQAITDFTASLQNHYRRARALHGLAVARLEACDWDAARANLLESLDLDPTDREVRGLLEQLDRLANWRGTPAPPSNLPRRPNP